MRYLCFLLLAAWACTKQPENRPAASPSPPAVATTSILADALRQLLPDSIEVVALMGPGVDPHLYKPTPADLQRLQQARLVVSHGLGLEGRLLEALQATARRRPVVEAGGLVDETLLIYPDRQTPDPHLWHDAGLWRESTYALADTLARLLPELAETLRRRADRLADSLGALDRWAKDELGSLPADRRLLVTAHDAFAYFGRAYGFEVHGVQGLSTTAEAGLHDVQQLIDLLVARRVPAVFVESSVPRRSVEAVLEGCRKRGHVCRLGGELHSDALGAPPDDSYAATFRHNVATIAQALRTPQP